MIFLRSIERLGDVKHGSGFPFDLPPVHSFRKLELTSPVTFFVGDNGTGKSTLLEAIALRAKLPCAAGRPLDHDPALIPIHPLARSLRLGWAPQTKHGLFLRVEDFFQLAREAREKSEPAAFVTLSMGGVDVKAVAEKPRGTESSDFAGSAPSAGERFLDYVRAQCLPGGLHLIDEPEAVLSPQRQLAFMSVLKSLVDDNAQFIIATHSPILLAYPGAQLMSFDDGNITPVQYSELPHVNFTRNFLREPDLYLHDL